MVDSRPRARAYLFISCRKYFIGWSDCNRRWLSSADGSLVQRGLRQGNGSDVHGEYSWLALDWCHGHTGANSPVLWTTSFQCYGNSAVVFSQHFPAGLQDAPGGPRDFQYPSSRFPSFTMSSLTDVPMITFANQNAARTLHAGILFLCYCCCCCCCCFCIVIFPLNHFKKNHQLGLFPKGYTGGYGSGPIAFGSDADDLAHSRIFVLSPVNAFTAALHNVDEHHGTLSFGVGGLMAKLPIGYTSEFVATACDSQLTWRSQRYSGAVSRAFIEWG